LVSASTCCSADPSPLGFGGFVVLVGFGSLFVGVGVDAAVGVAVCRGFGVYVDLVGVRVLLRLGAVVDRVGVGVIVVREGVRRGVYVGVGVADEASSAGAAEVIGVSWPVAFGVPVSRMTNHPTPASRTSADKEARSGPATPLPNGRLWFVMLSNLAQVSVCQLLPDAALHVPLTIANV
jgi:hypothetical protein